MQRERIVREATINGVIKNYDLATVRPATVDKKVFHFVGKGKIHKIADRTVQDSTEYHFYLYK